MVSIFKKREYQKELEEIERELSFKRIKLTELFLEVNADLNRDTGTDQELNYREDEVNRMIKRMVELDKLINGKRSKYV